ncbi:PTS sugar transporter subunit IIA [Schnuerera sp. xch1]|uniref:PTS sugar transporter subunit IIA n=1 Tax=Schnuerera sp. xch1 TaxID=2874283 RepID=UPI001CBD80EF|nr:PTS sugar transporter subunit IIA [Schnuerera sp. xch1]MBZ2174960.1 PTS sugar transporter subunit IIA [Schnuerera sp. xch1]
MFNILIISHGSVAKGFYDTAEMIIGDVEGVRFAGIQPGESIENFGERLIRLTDEIYIDDGLLVLVDLYGGTPSNVSIIKLLNRYEKIQLISGLNLPILLEALGSRNFMSLDDATDNLINIGKDGIKNINYVLNERKIHDDDE